MSIDRTETVEAIVERLTIRGLLELVDAVSIAYVVPREQILGRSRLTSIVAARHAVFVTLRETGLSYPEIGALLNRDHSTVMSGCKPKRARVCQRPLAKGTLDAMRVRCQRCARPFGEHLAEAPHAHPKRQCAAFTAAREAVAS